MHPSSLTEGILIGLPNIEAVGKRNGLRRRTARTRGSAREVKQKAKEREHWAEPRWSMWAAALLEKVGRNSMAGLRWAQYIVQAPQLPKAQGKVGWTGCGQGIAWRVGTQRLLFFMYLLTRRWLDYSSTPICRSPMWDHYGRNDCIRACEHGCLKHISLGPFVVVDLFVFPLHLLFHIYSIFLYPHSSSHTSSALPWLSFLPSQVFFYIQTYTNWSYWTYVVDQAATPSPLQRAGIPGLWPIGGLGIQTHDIFTVQYTTALQEHHSFTGARWILYMLISTNHLFSVQTPLQDMVCSQYSIPDAIYFCLCTVFHDRTETFTPLQRWGVEFYRSEGHNFIAVQQKVRISNMRLRCSTWQNTTWYNNNFYGCVEAFLKLLGRFRLAQRFAISNHPDWQPLEMKTLGWKSGLSWSFLLCAFCWSQPVLDAFFHCSHFWRKRSELDQEGWDDKGVALWTQNF